MDSIEMHIEINRVGRFIALESVAKCYKLMKIELEWSKKEKHIIQ